MLEKRNNEDKEIASEKFENSIENNRKKRMNRTKWWNRDLKNEKRHYEMMNWLLKLIEKIILLSLTGSGMGS